MTVNVTEEIFAGRVADTLLQSLHGDLLGGHVNDDVGGNTVGEVVQPLKCVPIVQIGHTDRLVVQVDLGGGIVYFKLADQIAQLAQLTVRQHLCGSGVQHGDLGVGNFRNVRCEIAVLRHQQLAIGAGTEHGQTCNDARSKDDHHYQQDRQRHFHAEHSQIGDFLAPLRLVTLADHIAVLVHIQVILVIGFFLCPMLLAEAERGREQGIQAAPYHDHSTREQERIGVMDVQCGQGHIEIHKCQNRSHDGSNHKTPHGFFLDFQ